MKILKKIKNFWDDESGSEDGVSSGLVQRTDAGENSRSGKKRRWL